MKNSNAHIKLENYSRYTKEGKCILNNVSCSIEKNKLTAILGLSGEGKTTLMETICGLCPSTHTTSGNVFVCKDGMLVPRNVSKWFPNVAYSKQEENDYQKMQLRKALLSIAKCYNRPELEVDMLIKEFDLEKQKQIPFKCLSGGQKKRVHVISTILAHKEISIWDEPISGLDYSLAKKTIQYIKNTEGTGIISIHQISQDIVDMIDNFIIMHKSTVIYYGPVSNMQSHFESLGLTFSDGVFLPNYLMDIFSELIERNTQNSANTEALNKYVQEIYSTDIDNSQSKQQKNVFLVTEGIQKIRLSNILEIFKRTFYFEKGFKFKKLIIEIVWVNIYILSAYFFLKRLIGSYNSAFNLIRPINISLKEENTYDIIENLIRKHGNYMNESKEQIEKNIIDYWNISIFCRYSAFIPIFLLFFTIFRSYTIFTTNKSSFVELCKKNIEEKQFSVVEYFFANIIDILCMKTAFVLLFLISFIYFLKHQITCELELFAEKATISILPLFFTSLLSALCIGLYYFLFSLVPLGSKIRAFLINTFLTFTFLLPLVCGMFIEHFIAKPFFASFLLSKKYISIINIFSVHSIYGKFYSVIEILCMNDSLDNTDGNIKKVLKMTVAYLEYMQNIFAFSPFNIIQSITLRWYIYRGYIPLNYRYIIEPIIIEYIKKPPSEIILFPSSDKDLLERIDKIKNYLSVAHEYNHPYWSFEKGVSLFSLLLSVLSFFLIPILLSLPLLFFRYRKMQPKIR